MKKVISVTLILVLVLTSATFAFAGTPPGLAKKGGLPPGIAKKFLDIDGYDWAQKAIERMAEKGVVNGIGEGKFAPGRAVTKLEAIVMALRVMGEEQKATEYQIKIKGNKVEFKLKENLQEWAYGYVKLAEEKGILDEADMIYFKLNEPATRHEVAKYLVRAMGYEDEAEKYMDADLDYKDAAFIPQGSVGYIYVANEKEIITGYPDGTFKPFDVVTRAEMAVMVARLEGKVVDDDLDIYEGEVTDIDTVGSSRSIKLDDNKIYKLTDTTKVVYEDNKEADIEDIKIGDEVKVEVNENDEAIKVIIERESEDRSYQGIVTSIGTNKFSMFALNYINKTAEFNIDEDFEIDFEDGKGSIADLRTGHEIKVIVENSKVTQIIVENDKDSSVLYGRLDNIYKDEKQILVYLNSSYKTYALDEDVEILVNLEDADLDGLKKDDIVVLNLDSSNEVIEINAYR